MADSTVAGYLDRGEPEALAWSARRLLLGTLLKSMTGPRSTQTGVTVYADESDEVDGIVTKVYATAGGLTGHKDILPYVAAAPIAPAAGQCSVEVNATTGKSVVHTANADAVTAITVEYLPFDDAYAALLAEMKG